MYTYSQQEKIKQYIILILLTIIVLSLTLITLIDVQNNNISTITLFNYTLLLLDITWWFYTLKIIKKLG